MGEFVTVTPRIARVPYPGIVIAMAHGGVSNIEICTRWMPI
jgi:hypothetical protein